MEAGKQRLTGDTIREAGSDGLRLKHRTDRQFWNSHDPDDTFEGRSLETGLSAYAAEQRFKEVGIRFQSVTQGIPYRSCGSDQVRVGPPGPPPALLFH